MDHGDRAARVFAMHPGIAVRIRQFVSVLRNFVHQPSGRSWKLALEQHYISSGFVVVVVLGPPACTMPPAARMTADEKRIARYTHDRGFIPKHIAKHIDRARSTIIRLRAHACLWVRCWVPTGQDPFLTSPAHNLTCGLIMLILKFRNAAAKQFLY